MRRHGTLVDWKDSRGFGFIEPAASTERIFVHVSSFRRSTERPRAGLVVSFEIDVDDSGRKRAINVMRPGDANRMDVELLVESRTESRSSSWLGGLLPVVFVVGAIMYFLGQERIASLDQQAPKSRVIPSTFEVRSPSTTEPIRFQCDGRVHCSQMRSCEEAEFFLRHCPDTKMDGDGDGLPCEMDPC
jgi:cold shock CspA family protein